MGVIVVVDADVVGLAAVVVGVVLVSLSMSMAAFSGSSSSSEAGVCWLVLSVLGFVVAGLEDWLVVVVVEGVGVRVIRRLVEERRLVESNKGSLGADVRAELAPGVVVVAVVEFESFELDDEDEDCLWHTKLGFLPISINLFSSFMIELIASTRSDGWCRMSSSIALPSCEAVPDEELPVPLRAWAPFTWSALRRRFIAGK